MTKFVKSSISLNLTKSCHTDFISSTIVLGDAIRTGLSIHSTKSFVLPTKSFVLSIKFLEADFVLSMFEEG